MVHTSRTNFLKYRALEIFARYGALNPPAWAILGIFSPFEARIRICSAYTATGSSIANTTTADFWFTRFPLAGANGWTGSSAYSVRNHPKTAQWRLPMARRSQVRLNETVGKRLLNVKEAAQYLGLEVDTVYKKARLRELPFVKVGRALRFDVKALERFIEQNAKPIL